jgi:hypothetical protein
MAISISNSARELAMLPESIVRSGDICRTLTLVHLFSATDTLAGYDSNLFPQHTKRLQHRDPAEERHHIAVVSKLVSGYVGQS